MVPCISCRALISREAKLCPTCRSYQVNWKNDLAYFGSTAGFIAILASAVTFISGQLAEGWRVATWKDIIQPVYFEYPGDVALINSGDGDAVVASVDVTWGEVAAQHGQHPDQQTGAEGWIRGRDTQVTVRGSLEYR